ncbi:MAG TPA: hypothetical protein VHE78_08315 [Gemmatimonadaceae bacterium]|nr:hypothetical protein [Gemmatimonadaceae bacterium]
MATNRAFAWALGALVTCCAPPILSAQGLGDAPAANPPEEGHAERYLAVGAAVGSPGYANLTATLFLPRVVLRAAGGLGGSGRWGLQGDVVLPLVRAAQLSAGVALVGGTFTTREASADGSAGNGALRQQVYLGAALDLALAGFQLQAGLGHGFRDYPPNQQLLARFGYAWRVR